MTDRIPPWTLGWRLQRALSWADMTTEEMAYELGVARSTVSRWCNDKGHPTRGYLKLWAQRTSVPMEWLITGEALPRVDSNHQPADSLKDLEESPTASTTAGYVPQNRGTAADLLDLRSRLPLARVDLPQPPDSESSDRAVSL